MTDRAEGKAGHKVVKVYIAGPMRGKPGCNLEAFDAAEARWQAAGWSVLSPARLARALVLDPDHAPDGTTPERRVHLLLAAQTDLAAVYAADALALLRGWECSRGATMELAVANFLGIPVYDAETMRLIRPPLCPWGDLWALASEGLPHLAGVKPYQPTPGAGVVDHTGPADQIPDPLPDPGTGAEDLWQEAWRQSIARWEQAAVPSLACPGAAAGTPAGCPCPCHDHVTDRMVCPPGCKCDCHDVRAEAGA